jgi:hypothetical protein
MIEAAMPLVDLYVLMVVSKVPLAVLKPVGYILQKIGQCICLVSGKMLLLYPRGRTVGDHIVHRPAAGIQIFPRPVILLI